MQNRLGTELAEVVLNAIATGQHAYGYTNGQLTTDTWTVGGTTYVKTYAYTNGVLTGESDWMKQ